MNARTFSLVVAILLGMGLAGDRLLAVPFQEANTYDFSQTANGTWSNYCAPTVAGDLVYHFGNTYPSLLQGNGYPPTVGASDGATTIIGGMPGQNGADPPGGNGPPAGSLANLMGTLRTAGTTLDNLKAGLASYLTANSSVTWNTQELLVANGGNPKGQNFFNTLQTDLSGGADVILVVAWQNAQPPAGGNYQLPNGYDAHEFGSSAIGHAFEMYGYDANTSKVWLNDPANNGGANSWVPEATSYNLAGANWPGSFEFNVGNATAIAYGAVVVQPTPEPSTLLLLAACGAGLGALGLRRLTRGRRHKA